MANAYVSFLGTNDYLPCTYFVSDFETKDVRFVQEATVQYCCRDWKEQDCIFVFTTEEAFKTNWKDDGHKDKDGRRKKCEGLECRLKQMPLKTPIRQIRIPEGKSEDQIWEIFQIVYDQLPEGARIVFDITHALRSIPMLAMVVLHYGKVLKGWEVDGIYYGAFETLGTQRQAEAMPLQQRRAPIFNLTSFDQLLDWTLSIDRFLGSGDAKPLADLALNSVHGVLRDTQGRDEAAASIREVAKRLDTFSRSLATCRGPHLSAAGVQLKEQIQKCLALPVIRPMRPLLQRLHNRMESFVGDEINDGIQAAKWCLEHNLIQQGYTILREVLINHLLTLSGVDRGDQAHRELASRAIAIRARAIPRGSWKGAAAEDPATTERYLSFVKPEHARALANLRDYRNDINHAGYRSNPMSADSLEMKLGEAIEAIEAHVSGAGV